jgi:deoxyribonuclease-4
MILGCHLSSSKGFHAMGKEALNIGANTFQFFTRNPVVVRQRS